MWDMIWQLITEYVWNSMAFLRVFSLILIIAISMVLAFRKQIVNLLLSKDQRYHDQRLFEESDKLLNEVEFKDMIEHMGGGCRVFYSQLTKLGRYHEFFKQESNQYLEKKLRKRNISLAQAIDRLRIFLAQHFFYHCKIGKDTQFMLYPALHDGEYGEEGSKRFRKYQIELNALLDDVENRYRDYRRLIRSNLYL